MPHRLVLALAALAVLAACNGKPATGPSGPGNGSSGTVTTDPPTDALSERVIGYARSCTVIARMVATCEVSTTRPPGDTAEDHARHRAAVEERLKKYFFTCLDKTRQEIDTMWSCLEPVTNCAGLRPCVGDDYKGKDSDRVLIHRM